MLKKNHSNLGFLYPGHGVDHELWKETEKKVNKTVSEKKIKTKGTQEDLKEILQRKQKDKNEIARKYKD